MVGAADLTVGEIEPVIGDGRLKLASSLLVAVFRVMGAST
jgi:hypothetical protein